MRVGGGGQTLWDTIVEGFSEDFYGLFLSLSSKKPLSSY